MLYAITIINCTTAYVQEKQVNHWHTPARVHAHTRMHVHPNTQLIPKDLHSLTDSLSLGKYASLGAKRDETFLDLCTMTSAP